MDLAGTRGSEGKLAGDSGVGSVGGSKDRSFGRSEREGLAVGSACGFEILAILIDRLLATCSPVSSQVFMTKPPSALL